VNIFVLCAVHEFMRSRRSSASGVQASWKHSFYEMKWPITKVKKIFLLIQQKCFWVCV